MLSKLLKIARYLDVTIKYAGKNKNGEDIFEFSTYNRKIIGTPSQIESGLYNLISCVYCNKDSINDVCDECREDFKKYKERGWSYE